MHDDIGNGVCCLKNLAISPSLILAQIDFEYPHIYHSLISLVEDAVEKFDEVTKNLEDKVAEIGNLEPEKVENAAKETLNEIREMEAELKKEIEAEENALTPKQKTGMRRWLGDFWNGVSSGWDN